MGLSALLAAALLPALQSPLLPPAERLRPVPARDVHLAAGSFWGPRVATNLLVSLQHGAAMLEEHGQFGNFRMAAGKQGHALPAGDLAPDKYSGCFYYDSDAYKWLEACCLALPQDAPEGTDPAAADAAKADIRARVDRFVEEIAAAQREDGYLNTQYLVEGWTPFSKLGSDHELYCAGHLIQAAIAHHDATGNRRLIDVALRFAELIDRTFGPDASKDQRPGCCGHPELETALVQLFHHTGEKRWLDLAAFLLECRGKGLAGGDDYRQDDKPIREQREARGHAVRQLYLCSGVLGVGAETGDAGLLDANLAIWKDIVAGKLYVTGGLGARPDGEAFGAAFELPNERAYSETCASVAWMRWNHELLQATGEAKYADALETTLYNAFLASTGLDGKSFFYVNPLESRGGHARQPWYWCACCPPNVMRTFAGLPGWFASTTQDTLWLQLYDDCTIDATLGDGRKLKLQVETSWPWSGPVRVRLLEVPQGPLRIAYRFPGFGRYGSSSLHAADGHYVEATAEAWGSTAPLWIVNSASFAVGQELSIGLGFENQRRAADPRVAACEGRVAVTRGPLVFAFESTDNGPRLPEERLAGAGEIAGEPAPDLGGIFRLHLPGLTGSAPSQATLYPLWRNEGTSTTLEAIPYYAWAQRGDSSMRVWMPAVPRTTSFDEDVGYLAQHADVVVLRADGGPVAISPRLTGRVMTTAFAGEAEGLGLVNRTAIEAGPVQQGFANYGGEDRLWLAPEGGPFALFFPPGAEQDTSTWSVPPALDGGPRTVTRRDERSLSFDDVVTVSNARKTTSAVRLERKIEVLTRAEAGELIGQPLPPAVRFVAFRSTNKLSPAGVPIVDALMGLWTLGQFKPSARTTVLFPFHADAQGADLDACLKRDYFGVVPEDRLRVELPAGPEATGLARFTADSRLRSKIGLSRAGATGWIGAWDEDRGVLTLVNHSLPPVTAAVPDCDWRVPNPHAAKGDVATSYNNGGEPAFFELESLSAALAGQPDASVVHVSTTIHLAGEREALRDIAQRLLHADL